MSKIRRCIHLYVAVSEVGLNLGSLQDDPLSSGNDKGTRLDVPLNALETDRAPDANDLAAATDPRPFLIASTYHPDCNFHAHGKVWNERCRSF